MKKKNLFMFALASFMFAACSENLPDGGDDGGGIINTDGEAWVSLNIKAGTATKALHNPDEEMVRQMSRKWIKSWLFSLITICLLVLIRGW